jgi:copper chaperone CopZ
MRQKAIVSGLCLGIIHFFSSTFFSEVAQKESLTRITGGFIGNAVLPLLSSACCSIQLIINSLASAGGCAGFNSYLGPVRPYFFSLLVYLTIISRTDLSVRRWIIESFVRFSLALLPEMVHWSNNYRTRKWTIKKRIKIEHGHPHTQLQEAQIELDIPTMGCVACINKIDAAIRSTAPLQIISSESWLDSARRKGGNSLIRLSVSSKEEADFIAESIVEKVEQAGFDSCRVESMLVVDSCESEAL